MLADTIEVAKWCESEGADAIHVSTGSLFPHPLNPPGDFSFETIATTYDAMISSGVDAFRNFLLFRYRLLRPIFRWVWFRMKKGLPIEGVSLEEARAIKANVSVPVLNTGGYQTASFVRAGLASGAFDGVAIARSLVANNDLVRQWASGRDSPERPCTYCNKCLLNAPKNPMGCYELARFPSRDAMIDELMTIYATRPTLNLPPVAGAQSAPDALRARRQPARRGKARWRNGPEVDCHERRTARHLRRNGVAPAAAVSARSGADRARAVAAGRPGRRRPRRGRPPSASRATARRPIPTSSPISSAARSAPTKAAACRTGSGRRCRGCSPRRSTAARDYRAFGFLYRTDDQGRQEDLPIGISKRDYQGVDLVWFNCAVCHTGTYRTSENGARVTVAGMPSNNLDLYRFIRFVLEAGADERLAPDTLIPAMQAAGAKLGLIERQVWRYYVIPRVREGFIQRRSRLQPFLAEQAAWGPGRVDTFNPYKLVQMKMALSAIAPGERNGASDFPSIFNQKPREGHAIALGRQQPVAGRTQSVGRARRRRHARVRRPRRDRARGGMARRSSAPAQPASPSTRPRPSADARCI